MWFGRFMTLPLQTERMLCEIVCDASTKVETLVIRADEVNALVRGLAGECATEQRVGAEFDAMRRFPTGIEQRPRCDHSGTLDILRAIPARVEALGCVVKGHAEVVKKLQGSVGGLLKSVVSVDGKANATASKPCALDTRVDSLSAGNEKRHGARGRRQR